MALFQKGQKGGPGAPKRPRFSRGWFLDMVLGCYSRKEWQERFKSIPAEKQYPIVSNLFPKEVKVDSEEQVKVTFQIIGVRADPAKAVTGDIVDVTPEPVKELPPAVDSGVDPRIYQPTEETRRLRQELRERKDEREVAVARRERENDMLRAQSKSMGLPEVTLPSDPAHDPGPRAENPRKPPENELWASLEEDPDRPNYNRAGRRLYFVDPDFLNPPPNSSGGGLKNC